MNIVPFWRKTSFSTISLIETGSMLKGCNFLAEKDDIFRWLSMKLISYSRFYNYPKIKCINAKIIKQWKNQNLWNSKAPHNWMKVQTNKVRTIRNLLKIHRNNLLHNKIDLRDLENHEWIKIKKNNNLYRYRIRVRARVFFKRKIQKMSIIVIRIKMNNR